MRRLLNAKLRYAFPGLFLAALFVCASAIAGSGAARWIYAGPDAGFIGSPLYDLPIFPDRADSRFVYAKVRSHSGGLQIIYRSEDAGWSWKICPVKNISQAFVHPASSEIFVTKSVRQGTELWKSKDHGKTFARIFFSKSILLFHLIPHPTDPRILFSLYPLQISNDGGRNWQAVHGLPRIGEEYNFIDLLVSPFDGQTLYLSAEAFLSDEDPQVPLLFVSHDRGTSWTLVEQKIYRFHWDPVFPDRAFAFGSDGEVKTLTKRGWVHLGTIPYLPDMVVSLPHHKNRILALSGSNVYERQYDVYETQDEGRTWNKVDAGLKNSLSALASVDDPFGTVLAGTNGAGIFRRDDRHSWRFSGKGIQEAVTSSVSANGQSMYATIQGKFVAYTASPATNWNVTIFGRNYPVSVTADPGNPQRAFLNFGLFVSLTEDGGKTWNKLGPYCGSIFDPKNPAVIYFPSFSGKVFKSTDSGKTQYQLPLGKANVFQILVDENNTQNVFFVDVKKGLLKSNDAGMSVVSANSGIDKGIARAISILPAQDSFAAITDQGVMYKTDDSGHLWREFVSLPCHRAGECTYKLFTADSTGKHFFLLVFQRSRSPQLQETNDGGFSWKDISDEFGKGSAVFDLTDPRRPPFYVATNHGVFRSR